MDLEPTLSPRFLVYIRNYLLDADIDPAPVFAACGLGDAFAEEYANPIPVPQVASLFETAVRFSGNRCLGLHMAQQYHFESAPIVILAMLAAPTVEEGLNCLCRYDVFIDTGIDTRFRAQQDPVEFNAGLIDLTGAVIHQLNEYLLAFIVQILKTATRKQVPVQEVWFRHGNSENERELTAHFNAPVSFGRSDNRLLFSRDFLSERFLTSNAFLQEILTDALESYYATNPEHNSFVDAVSREIMRLDIGKAAGLDTVAASLALSPRTLRRRLADEGHSFRSVKNLARDQRARYYLTSTSLSMSEIAFQLGYSEPSAFSRAFRRRVGETPQGYRDRLQKRSAANVA